jgi:hypothetical protein
MKEELKMTQDMVIRIRLEVEKPRWTPGHKECIRPLAKSHFSMQGLRGALETTLPFPSAFKHFKTVQ